MRIAKVLVALVAIIGVTVGATLVAAGEGGSEGGPPGNAGQNPNARLQVLVQGQATVGQFGYARQKNLQTISNPLEGVFCIQPTAASGITPAKAIPNVTLLEGSQNLTVVWRFQRVSCPVKTFEFAAYVTSSGLAENEAGFTVTVG